jgi:hypothetical protein
MHTLSITNHKNNTNITFHILYISKLISVIAHIIDSDGNVVATHHGTDKADVDGHITDWALQYANSS